MNNKKAAGYFFLFLINYLVIISFSVTINLKQIFISHLFLFILSIVSDFLKRQLNKIKNNTPFYFLLINFFRICVCLVFLFSSVVNPAEQAKIYVCNFIIIYFLYLFIDLVFEYKKQDKINI